MCGIRQQIGLTPVACRVVAVPKTTVAEADGAATGSAVGRGIGNDARRGGAASAVLGIVVDVDFASVVGKAIAITVASQATRDGAEPVGPTGRRGLCKRARDAGFGRASVLRLRLGYALVVTELQIRATFPILEVIQVDGERAGGKGVEACQEQHTEAHVPEGTHAQNSVCIAKWAPEVVGEKPNAMGEDGWAAFPCEVLAGSGLLGRVK